VTVDTFELTLVAQEGQTAVLEVAGYINNEGGEVIAREARKLLDSGCRNLLFDLRATRIINSIGISLLLEVLERTLGQGHACLLLPDSQHRQDLPDHGACTVRPDLSRPTSGP
jgi:anti-anti-sigma regulatory factor